MLKDSLKTLLIEQDLEPHQAFILSLSEQLGVSVLEVSAALLQHNKVNIALNIHSDEECQTEQIKPEIAVVNNKYKRVRYRLEVGRKHQILLEEIKNVLIEVSGVEKKQIGRVDVRHHYTLVDLPYGMPADVFQLLSETEIQQQKLNIKRIKTHRRYNNQQRKPRKRYSSAE